MFDVSFRVDYRDVEKNLDALMEKQVPFAQVLALNELGARVVKAEKINLKSKFPTATPFTINSIAMLRARKSTMQVVIYMRDIAAEYMEPFEVGGVHKLNSRALLNPKDINLNQYGNLPKGKLSALRGRSDVFIGPVKGKNGQAINGVWQRMPAAKGQPARLRLLIRFGDALPVKIRLDYAGIGARTIKSWWAPTYRLAMQKALATAKG